MKNFTHALIWLLFTQVLWAQSQKDWAVSFDKAILWSKISSTGNLLVCTQEALYGIDPEVEGEAWRIPELAEIEENQLEEIDDTPFALISGVSGPRKSIGGGIVKLPKSSSSRFWLINTYTGDNIFDSKVLGFSSILGKALVLESEAFFVMGIENKERVLAMVSIGGEGLRWKQKVPVQTKRFTFKDTDFYSPILDPEGNLVYYYGNKLFRLDIGTGDILWEQPYPSVKNITFGQEGKGVFYAVAGMDSKLNAFSLGTGEPLWFDVLPGTLGNAFKSKEKKDEVTLKAIGTVSEASETRKNAALLRSPRYRVEEDDQFLLVSYKGFNYYGYESADPKWDDPYTFQQFKVNRVVPAVDGYVLRLIADEQWFLTYCDAQGQPLWEKPHKVSGNELSLFVMTPHGLVYMSNQELDILDKTTGQSRMGKAFKLASDNEFLPYFDWEKGWAVIYQNKSIYKIDFSSASPIEITDKVRLKGDGKDFPSTLEEVEGGYFLANDQNLVKIDYQGNIAYQQYHRRPGAPMWLKRTAVSALNVAMAAAIVYLSQQAQVGALSSYYRGEMNASDAYLTLTTFDLENPDNPLYELGGAAQEAYGRIAARKQASYTGNKEVFVLSKLEDDNVGLKRIAKDSGDETGSLVLDDKNPSYAVDEFLQVLYYFASKKEIQAFKLKAE